MTTPALALTPVPAPTWFGAWFDSPYYHRLYAHRDDAEAATAVDAILTRLRPRFAATALDLGCGAGRHARRLAAQGLDVTGLDLSAASIQQARRHEGRRLRFRRHDMREPFGDGAFDFIFSFFTSFGYFETADEHRVVMDHMARALAPGGRLVLDYLNVGDADARITRSETVSRGTTRFHLRRWADAGRYHKRIVVEDPALTSPLVFFEQVARFTLQDFRAMFASSGLAVESTYGDYVLAPYHPRTSPRLVMVVRQTQ